ncbi:hypothetical protein Hanom_Chr08g00709671 [Helianthus anomalus]
MVKAVLSDESGGVVGSPSFLHTRASIFVKLVLLILQSNRWSESERIDVFLLLVWKSVINEE